MIFNNNFSYVVRDKRSNFFKFYLSSENSLMVDQINNTSLKLSTLLTKDVCDFSLDIDRDDNIHLLFLNSIGEMNYLVYPNVYSKKALARFDFSVHSIKFLTIKNVCDDIHIFYMMCKKDTGIYGIYHSFWHGGSWSTNKVAEVTAQKHVYPYMIDIHKNYIYLFYSKDSRFSYGIKKFNLDFYMWGDLDDNIELPNSLNASFLINNKNIAFICYSASVNRNIYTMVRYRDLGSNYAPWSKQSQLSEHSVNAIHPSIAVKNNYTYILWEEGENIVFKKTDSGTINWSTKDILFTAKSSTANSIYTSTHPADVNYKNTFSPTALQLPPYPVINTEKTVPKQNFIEKEKTTTEEVPAAVGLANMITKDEYIRQLQLVLIEKDRRLLEITRDKEVLSNENQKLAHTLMQKDTDVVTLKNQLSQLEESYSSSMKAQQEKIDELVSELSEKSSLELEELKNSLSEKGRTLEKLNKLLNSLYQENNLRDRQIEALELQLEQNRNKGILKRIFK